MGEQRGGPILGTKRPTREAADLEVWKGRKGWEIRWCGHMRICAYGCELTTRCPRKLLTNFATEFAKSSRSFRGSEGYGRLGSVTTSCTSLLPPTSSPLPCLLLPLTHFPMLVYTLCQCPCQTRR